jgi:hypothetical protein
MSELGILELETEHAELLPEREALGTYYGGYNWVHATQWAYAQVNVYNSTNVVAAAAATNSIFTG